MGEKIIIEYLKSEIFQDSFKELEKQIDEIFDLLIREEFINGFFLECHETGSYIPCYILLILFKYLDNGGKKYENVCNIWNENEYWKKINNYESYPWLDSIKELFAEGTELYTEFKITVSNACNEKQVSTYTQKEVIDITSSGAPIVGNRKYERVEYGHKVVVWLNSLEGPRKYNLRSDKEANNMQSKPIGDGGGCVIAGTLIQMADGTKKPIEDIKENDLVLNGNGSISICSSELIVNRNLKELYSINDDEPFMSYDHAIMTQRGWCSLKPNVSMNLNSHIVVNQLKVGDVVWKLKGIVNNKPDFEKIEVKKINTISIGEEEVVGYDIHFREGYMSYCANNYCCLLNYPEITIDRINSNINSNMNYLEKNKFKNRFKELEPMFRKTFGDSAITLFKSVLEDENNNKDLYKLKNRSKYINFNDRVFTRIVVKEISGKLPNDFFNLAFINGNLFINGNIVDTYCENNYIYWNRVNLNGEEEIGKIELNERGTLGKGLLISNGKISEFKASIEVEYLTKYDDVNDWYSFKMGFFEDECGHVHSFGKLIGSNENEQEELDKYTNVVFSETLDEEGMEVLHVSIKFDINYCALGFNKFRQAEFDFNMNYERFSGKLYEYDYTQKEYKGTEHKLIGIVAENESISNMKKQVTNKLLKEPLQEIYLNPNLTISASNSVKNKINTLNVAMSLSVEDLFSMPMPDMEEVHKLSFSKMKLLMLYVINDEWRRWFGEEKPIVGPNGALSEDDVKLLENKEIEDFLINKFAVPYLTQAFSSSDAEELKSKFKKIYKYNEKMEYFWKGNGDTSFAKDKNYNIITSQMLNSAYLQSVPRLQEYIKDDRKKWAKELYEYCTNRTTLVGLALNNTLDGRKRLNHLSTMLQCLDSDTKVKLGEQSVSYSLALYEQVINIQLANVVECFTAVEKDEYVDFLTEYFTQYFNSLLSGDIWEESIRQSALSDLQELMKEFNVDNINDLINNMNSILSQMVDTLISLKDMPFAGRINQLAKQFPKVSKLLGGALTFGVYGLAIMSTVKGFMDWNNLEVQEKSEVIINLVNTAALGFRDFSKYMSLKNLTIADAKLEELMAAAAVVKDVNMQQEIIATAENMAQILNKELPNVDGAIVAKAGEVAAADLTKAEDIAIASSKWTKIAKIGEIASEAMTIIALAATCVCTGFQIAKDFKTGQPLEVKVFDILEEVTNAIAFVCAVGVGIFAFVEITCSVIPVIGFVAAIAGIIISFVNMFLPRKKQESNQEKFVDNESKNFVDALEMPTEEWLKEQQAVKNQINGSNVAISII